MKMLWRTFCFLTLSACFTAAFDLMASSNDYQRRKIEEARARKAEADAERAKAQAETAKAKAESERLKKDREKDARAEKTKKTDWDGKMLYAIAKGDKDAFKLAMDNGANINANRNGWNGDTALHVAVRANEPDFLKMLLRDYKMDVNTLNFQMMTPLHLASMAGYTDAMMVLLANKADTERITSGGMSALQLAVLHGNVKAVRLLCDFDCMIPSNLDR